MSGALCLRPLVVRFTDAHVEDAHLDLVYERDGHLWPMLHPETVAEVKNVLRADDPQRHGRRLRLIHFGRVLPNALALAPYLDTLLPSQEADRAEATWEQVLLDKTPHASGYTLHRAHDPTQYSKQWGKQRAEEARDESFLPDVGPFLCDVLRLSVAYLQCSVGAEGADTDERAEAPPQAPEPRGFDRLRYTAGMSALDVQVMREHFHQRSGLVARSGDLIRRQEEDELAYTLEEQWIDNMGETPEALVQSQRTSAQRSALQGLLMGFFFPLLPFFFAWDLEAVWWPPAPTPQQMRETEQLWSVARLLSEIRHHPPETPNGTPDAQIREEARETAQALTSLLTARQTRQQQQQPDERDDDEEEGLGSGRHALVRSDHFVVFSPEAHFGMMVGLAMNVLLGVLRTLV